MKRSRSRKPLRRASSPHPRAQTPPKASLSKAATSPSLRSETDSQPDLPHSPGSTPRSSWYETEDYQDELQKWHLESSSVQRDQLRGSESSSRAREVQSRSTQTELCAEDLELNEPANLVAAEALPEENVKGEPWYDFRRLLGPQRNTSSFLVSMAVLTAVLFTVGVIAAISGKAGAGDKANNLELIPDAFDNEQVAAHEEVDVTLPTTGAMTTSANVTALARYAPSAARRKATVVRRRRPATVALASRKPAVKARKLARATRRRLKSTTRKRSALSSTSTARKRTAQPSTRRRSRTTKRNKKRRSTARAKKVRRPGAGILARHDHITTGDGQRKGVTADIPYNSITDRRKKTATAAVAHYDLTAGLEPRKTSVASRSKTSRRTPSRLDEDDDTV